MSKYNDYNFIKLIKKAGNFQNCCRLNLNNFEPELGMNTKTAKNMSNRLKSKKRFRVKIFKFKNTPRTSSELLIHCF